MEELSLDNILSEDQIASLFENNSGDNPDDDSKDNAGNSDDGNKKEKEETTEINVDTLFEDNNGLSESVGSGTEDTKEKEDTSSNQGVTSPNFYSSIADALVGDGIFQDLDKETIGKIKTAEDFAETIDSQVENRVKAKLDKQQKRVIEALNAGMEASEIRKHENYIAILSNITEEKLTSEDEEGENLRKNLIYQDFINKGYSKERATKMAERSIKDGNDVEDAKEALQSNLSYLKNRYDEVLNEAKKEVQEKQEEIKKQATDLKNMILDGDKAFGDVDVDKATRKKVYESIMKPIYTDPDTGDRLTEIQKYESENRLDFLKNVGLLYVLTDGFKNINKLVQGKVKKEVRKGLRELEHTINNTSRTSTGSLNFLSGTDDLESKFSNWKLDV